MVDISYSVDAKHHCQHAASKISGCAVGRGFRAEMWKRKCNEVEREVRWTAARAKLAITYMHHGRTWVCTEKCRETMGTAESWRRVNTTTNLGEISHPCCMKAPSENHRLLKIPKSLGGSGGLCGSLNSSFSSRCHSYGLKRLTRKSTTLTPM